MSELPVNYENKDQLPLFGLVYCETKTEYQYLLAGTRISRESQARWEESDPVQGYPIKLSRECVCLEVQPAAA